MVSPSFLASDFIVNHELPHFLEAVKKEGAIILPIIIEPCAIKYTPLGIYQAINAPSRTILEMDDIEKRKFFVEIVDKIVEAYNSSKETV